MASLNSSRRHLKFTRANRIFWLYRQGALTLQSGPNLEISRDRHGQAVPEHSRVRSTLKPLPITNIERALVAAKAWLGYPMGNRHIEAEHLGGKNAPDIFTINVQAWMVKPPQPWPPTLPVVRQLTCLASTNCEFLQVYFGADAASATEVRT